MSQAHGYAAQSAHSPLAPFSFERRAPGPHDVRIDILYCGICHSDLHTVRDEWHNTRYPCVPGHEIVGRVSAVGSEVKGFKVGEVAEPRFREGMARSMARRFDAQQLGEIQRFLATPTGAAYGRQMMGLWFDPEVMRGAYQSLPEMMKLMPDMMKDAASLEATMKAPKKAE